MITTKEINSIYLEYNTPPHVIKHCIKVAAVAIFLAKKLNLNSEQIKAAGLLHDALRVCDFKNFDPKTLKSKFSATDSDITAWLKIREEFKGLTHSEAIAKILNQKGYPTLAKTILAHDYSKILDPSTAPQSLAEKIIYYADKRVCHDQIVSLEERISEGLNRYYKNKKIPEHIILADQKGHELEQELTKKAKITPDQINEASTKEITKHLIKDHLKLFVS